MAVSLFSRQQAMFSLQPNQASAKTNAARKPARSARWSMSRNRPCLVDSPARRISRAGESTKHGLFRDMLQRALRAGFRAAFVLADAWFGCKENIACCLENKLTAIFQ